MFAIADTWLEDSDGLRQLIDGFCLDFLGPVDCLKSERCGEAQKRASF
jgi:hypothetical protein